MNHDRREVAEPAGAHGRIRLAVDDRTPLVVVDAPRSDALVPSGGDLRDGAKHRGTHVASVAAGFGCAETAKPFCRIRREDAAEVEESADAVLAAGVAVEIADRSELRREAREVPGIVHQIEEQRAGAALLAIRVQ